MNNLSKRMTMKKQYTKKQIMESIKYWQKQLKAGNYKKTNSHGKFVDEATRFNLLKDKHSVTSAFNKHNDEITDFYNQEPKPTKDQFIDFIAQIFKEENIDTPYTRQFLIKMKMYCPNLDDAIYYVTNARLAGENLSTNLRKYHENEDALDESEEKDVAPTQKQIDSKKDSAKKEASKVKTPDDAKKFLSKYKADIDKMSSKLKGDAKKNFGKIVDFMQKYADGKQKLDESSNDTLLRIIFGCAGIISFMVHLNTFAWIVLSPIVGPLLFHAVKRLSGLK